MTKSLVLMARTGPSANQVSGQSGTLCIDMLIQPAHLFDAATSTHVPTPGHHSSHPQPKRKGDRIQTSRVQDQPFPGTTTYQENEWYQVDQPGNWEGTDERELIYESLDVEEYEYADGDPEGGEDDDQVFSCLQEDEETGNGLGEEVEYEYEYDETYFQDGNEEEGVEGEEVEYTVSELVQPVGDEEEGEEGEEVEYAVSELVQPVGDDEGELEPYYPQDEDDADSDSDSDGGQGGEDGADYYEDEDD